MSTATKARKTGRAAPANTTSQKHARLKQLAEQAGKSVFDMLALADEILLDREYCEQFGGEPQLIDMLEENEFAHFGGNPSLPALLRAYRTFPRREDWRERRYNVWAMIELAQPAPEAASKDRTNWKQRCAELTAANETLTAELTHVKDRLAAVSQDLQDQRLKVANLQGRLETMEAAAR